MIKPWEEYIQPHHIYGNLYFVGCKSGSTHLIDTKDGLVLIDTGYPQNLYHLLENIRAIGFDPKNIKHIIHSHGHYDHLGATKALIELYHPKTYIGVKDVPYANGEKDLTWARELGMPAYTEMFEPDVAIHDGETITIGGVPFYFLETPGHTEGTISIFFPVMGNMDIDHEETIYRAGMFGGSGTNSLNKTFLTKYGLPLELQQEFLNSIERLKQEHVDIHIGNHIGNNDMLKKLSERKMTGKNAFIDPDNFPKHLEATKEKMLDLLRREHMI